MKQHLGYKFIKLVLIYFTIIQNKIFIYRFIDFSAQGYKLLLLKFCKLYIFLTFAIS